MIEQMIDISTGDGVCDTFVVYPERDGPHPVVLFLMDAAGIREELRDMARRLATSGYFVALPNLFYRSGVSELGLADVDPDSDWFKRATSYAAALTMDGIMADIRALNDVFDANPAAGPERGCIGYCMSGQYAVRAGGLFPDRFAAIASFYSVALVTDRLDSPHLALGNARAEFYLGIAETDPWVPAEMMTALDETLTTNGATFEIEIYPGTGHGFAFPDRYSYDKLAAERHWERLHALFRRQLPNNSLKR